MNEIERKNKESEQFLYIASHDLNEPLRTMESMMGMLEARYHDRLDEDGRKFVFYIHSSIERMSTLIRSLLDYGRLGRDVIMEKTDCNEIVQTVISDLGHLITASGAEIKVDNLPVINAYSRELRHLFQNLIANAIKFHKPGVQPKIEISASQKGASWKFMVKDNGIGIDPAHSEKIFTIFRKLHSRDDYEGAGIGLANCRKIAEMHHGRIWVSSEIGKGSKFYFTIPIN